MTRAMTVRRTFLAAITIGVALLLNCRLPDTSEQSSLMGALERKSGRIVYMGTDGNIWVSNQSGGAKQQITADAGAAENAARIYQTPIWSPDGSRVAFVGIDTFQGRTSGRVLTSRTDGTEAHAISTGPRLPANLYWSPDSRKLSFLTAAAGGGGFLLLNWQPATSIPVQILDAGRPLFWAWAPDSTGMAVHSGSVRTTGRRISFLEVGATVIESGLSLQPAEFQTPAWSPDGSGVVLAAVADGGLSNLIIADREQHNRHEVIASARGSLTFQWSPDGVSLGYIARRQGVESVVSQLHLREISTGTETVLEEDSIFAFFWSPDSNLVAYFVPSVASQNEGTDQTLVLALRVYDRKRKSTVDIETFVPTPQFVSVIRLFDQYGQAARIWSPDSRNLIYAAQTEQGPSIMVARSAGNLVPRKMAQGLIGFWSWQ